MVSPSEYELAREQPRRFLTLTAHHDGNRIVSRHDGFVIVEKEGLEGELVERMSGE